MPQKWLFVTFSIIGLILMAIGAWAETFHSPNGYSITAPSGWSFNKPNTNGDDISLITKNHADLASNINVRLSAAPAGVSLKQVQADLKAGYPKMFHGYKFIGEKFTSVGGQPAYELLCNHKFGTPAQPLWVRQDVVIRGNKLYFFTCTALAANAAHSAGVFDTIIKSVHWTGK